MIKGRFLVALVWLLNQKSLSTNSLNLSLTLRCFRFFFCLCNVPSHKFSFSGGFFNLFSYLSAVFWRIPWLMSLYLMYLMCLILVSLVKHLLYYIIKLDFDFLCCLTRNPLSTLNATLLICRHVFIVPNTSSAHPSCLYPNHVTTDLNSREQEIQRIQQYMCISG